MNNNNAELIYTEYGKTIIYVPNGTFVGQFSDSIL
jgi:hypothetical protein